MTLDNYVVADGSLIASDADAASLQWPYVKMTYGADGTQTRVSDSFPLPSKDVFVGAILTSMQAALPGIGLTPYRYVSVGTNDLALVITGAVKLYGGVIMNLNAAVRYLHLYDKATAPIITDTGASVLRQTIPLVGSTVGLTTIFSIPGGLSFALGLGHSLTTTLAGTTDAVSANETVVNLWYK